MFTPTLKRTEPISESKKEKEKKKNKENEWFGHAETVNRLKIWWSNEAVVNLWQISNANLWEKLIIWCVESQVVFICFFDKFLRARDMFSANETRNVAEHVLSSRSWTFPAPGPAAQSRRHWHQASGTWASPLGATKRATLVCEACAPLI